ncbi:hypothetical protein MF672_045070 [Actinomadura sp. ATCC 31491]|uniref:DUF4232 domain-containing protein n=1 Tax=Actinomadura luzonensis TaxID=2805427 RepID=A0ABT0G8M7_9ACTN|nr:hypothetical protein [Actinomadura luzonensis]MCK2220931.1 hypothetical protein [Actinomadura luzonensis]
MKRLSLSLATAVLLAGCAAPAPRPSTDPPPGVSVSLAQWRSDEPVHRLQIAVRNATDTPVHFADVRLVTASFRTLPPQKVDTTLGRTERTDLPTPYGAANCLPRGLPQVRPATVVAHLSTGGGPPREVVFRVPHPDPLLARLLRDECSEYLVKQAADIAFGPEWTESDGAMRGELVLTRRGQGRVTLTDVGGTTHYNVTPGHRPLGTLEPGAQRLEVRVALTPGRCDPHAFAEAKKAFLFPVRASLDGGEARVVIVVPPRPLQERLIWWAEKVCGLGG